MRRSRLIGVWILLGLWACGDTGGAAGGCACADDYEYPRDQLGAVPSQGAARVRLTETGFDAIARMVPSLIAQGCADTDGDSSAACERHPDDPERIRLYMGEPCNPLESSTSLGFTSIDVEVRSGPCNGIDYHRSSLDLYLDSLEGNVAMRMVEDSEGPAIEVVLGCDEEDMNDCLNDGSQYAKGSLNMVWLLAGFWADNACSIADNDNVDAGLIVQKLRFLLRPKVELGDDLRPYLTFNSEDTTVDDLNLEFAIGQDAANSDPACSNGCDIWCTVTNGLTSAIEVLLETEFIASVIADAVVDGIIGELTKEPLELTGELDLAELIPIGNDRASPTGFLVTGDTESPTITGNSGNVGMNFDFHAGFFAEYVPCAPELAPPSWVLPMLDPPGAVVQAPDPVTGELHWEPFDIMVMLGDVLVERAAYNLFRGGSLCLNIGADDIDTLSAGAFVPTVSLFSLIAPGLATLADPDAPVMMSLTPNLPVMVDFGSGEEVAGEVDSHIKVVWPQLELALYPLVDDSYQRALAFGFNLNVGISLIPTPTGNLRLMIDKLALEDVAQSYNELGMPFDPASVADLIGVFLPALLEDAENLEIDLSSEALGFPISPKLRKIGAEGDQGRHLGIYMRVCTEVDIADESNTLCYEDPEAALEDTDTEEPQVDAADDGVDNGWELDVFEDGGRWFARLPEGLDAEDSWELAWTVDDRQPWFNFRPVGVDGLIELKHPLFGVPGPHRVSTMARQAHAPEQWVQLAEQYTLTPSFTQHSGDLSAGQGAVGGAPEAPLSDAAGIVTYAAEDRVAATEANGCTSVPGLLWWMIGLSLFCQTRRRSLRVS